MPVDYWRNKISLQTQVPYTSYFLVNRKQSGKNVAKQRDICGRTTADFLTIVHQSGDQKGAKRLFAWHQFWNSSMETKVTMAIVLMAGAMALRLLGVDSAIITNFIAQYTGQRQGSQDVQTINEVQLHGSATNALDNK